MSDTIDVEIESKVYKISKPDKLSISINLPQQYQISTYTSDLDENAGKIIIDMLYENFVDTLAMFTEEEYQSFQKDIKCQDIKTLEQDLDEMKTDYASTQNSEIKRQIVENVQKCLEMYPFVNELYINKQLEKVFKQLVPRFYGYVCSMMYELLDQDFDFEDENDENEEEIPIFGMIVLVWSQFMHSILNNTNFL